MKNQKMILIRFLGVMVFLLLQGCAQMRYAQTSIGQAIDSPVTVSFSWGEVYCGRGQVCAEVEVKRVDFEKRNGGRVEVTLHNRTGLSLSAQIALEIVSETGARLDSTMFQNIALPPRQEIVWEMPGIYHEGGKIRVLLRQRSNAK
jgi:hypothetical protein